MSECEGCITKPYSRQDRCVSSHELFRINDLKEPMRLSIGFWKEKLRGSFTLCNYCKARLLRQVADELEKEIEE